jgi:integrase
MLKLLEKVATLPTIRLGMRLYLQTMVRKSELQDATWHEIDFEVYLWRAVDAEGEVLDVERTEPSGRRPCRRGAKSPPPHDFSCETRRTRIKLSTT